MNLVIVESPAKAKTINKYLGKDYLVLASYGHIRDLPSKNGSVDPEKKFEMLWEIDSFSKKYLKEITDAAEDSKKIILATDPDREGEAIAWHVKEVLEKKKLLKEDTTEGEIDLSLLPSAMRDFAAFDQDFLSKTFRDLQYWQAHERPVDQKTAEGHSVRALYMFTAMADLARLNNDDEMLRACKTLWRNIVDKRMYVHSGVGSAHIGERFTFDYDLPNDMAYAETCATIALIYFANRMSKMELNSEYGDIIENSLYNLLLASTSLDGKGFFYDNYLECNPGYLHSQQRRHGIRDEYHMCSCCPPNITRLFASMDMYIYNSHEDSLVVDQYISCLLYTSPSPRDKRQSRLPCSA